MKNYYDSGRRDSNEKEIKDYLKKRSIPFVVLMPGQGADLLLLLNGVVVFVEVKNLQSSKQRQQLTEAESKFQSLCNVRSIYYIVAFSVSDIADCIAKLWFYMDADLVAFSRAEEEKEVMCKTSMRNPV